VSHRYGDERIAGWLQKNDYHPRSPKHGSASCQFFLDDLLYERDAIREAAASGEIVYQEDYTVGSGDSKWNTDLVVGPPADDIQDELDDGRDIVTAEPDEIWVAIDAKSVMTEHGKARRNRQRDINSFADIMHSHYPGAVTGGLLLINMASDDKKTELVTSPPAPQPGDIVHYRDFLEIIGETFEKRWLTGKQPDLSSLANADLQAALNQQVVDVAAVAHDVGIEIADGAVSEESLNALRTELTEVENVLDEIERRET